MNALDLAIALLSEGVTIAEEIGDEKRAEVFAIPLAELLAVREQEHVEGVR